MRWVIIIFLGLILAVLGIGGFFINKVIKETSLTVDSTTPPSELVEAVQTGNLPTRYVAAMMLREVDPLEEAHVEALKLATRDESLTVARVATLALLERRPELLPEIATPVARSLGGELSDEEFSIVTFAVGTGNFSPDEITQLTTFYMMTIDIESALAEQSAESAVHVLPEFARLTGQTEGEVANGAMAAMGILLERVPPENAEAIAKMAEEAEGAALIALTNKAKVLARLAAPETSEPDATPENPEQAAKLAAAREQMLEKYAAMTEDEFDDNYFLIENLLSGLTEADQSAKEFVPLIIEIGNKGDGFPPSLIPALTAIAPEDPRVKAFLKKTYETNRTGDLREAAALAAGLDEAPAQPFLGNMVEEYESTRDVQEKVLILEAVATEGPDAIAVLPWVLEKKDHSDPAIRASVAEILGAIGSPGADPHVDLLVKMSQETEFDPVYYSVDALGYLDAEVTRPHAPAILKAFDHEDEQIKLMVLEYISAAEVEEGVAPIYTEALRSGSGMLLDELYDLEKHVAAEVAVPIISARLQEMIQQEGYVSESTSESLLWSLHDYRQDANTALPVVLEYIDHAGADVRAVAVRAAGAAGGGQPEQVKEILVKALEDAEWSVRAAAAEEIGPYLKGQEDLVLLFNAMNDEDEDVQSAAASTLNKIAVNEDLLAVQDKLLEMVGHASWLVRYEAAKMLGRIAAESPKAMEALTTLADDEDPEVATESAMHLAQSGRLGPDKLSMLIEGLHSEYEDTQSAAAIALGHLGRSATQAVPKLLASFDSWNADLPEHAAWALGRIGVSSPEVIDGLEKALENQERSGAKAESMVALASLTGAQGDLAARIKEHARSDVPRIRQGALEAFGYFAEIDDEIVTTLAEAIGGENRDLAWSAMSSLRRQAPNATAALDALIAALENDDLEFASRAARVIGDMGAEASKAVEPLLVKARNAENPLAWQAMYGLGGIGEAAAEAGPLMVERLASEDLDRRWAAANTVDQAGAPAEDAVPALAKRVEEETEDGPLESVIYALGRYAPQSDDAVSTLRKVLEHENPDIVEIALMAFRDAPEKAAAEAELFARISMEAGNPSVRSTALYTLASVAPASDELAAAVRAFLQSNEQEIRDAAYTVFQYIAPELPELAPELVTLLQSGTEQDQWQAGDALGMIGPAAAEEALDALIEATTSALRDTRWAAVEALGRLGAAEAGVITALEKAAEDPDPEVSAAAKASLEALRPAEEAPAAPAPEAA